jgi:hypothetical protein
MTADDATRLEQRGGFLLRGLRNGASDELPVQLLRERRTSPPAFNPNGSHSAHRLRAL